MEAVRAKGPAHETELLLHVTLSPESRSSGIDIDARDNHGMTALMYAIEARNELAIRGLIAAGARVDQRNDSGLTAHDLARQNGLLQLLPPEQ